MAQDAANVMFLIRPIARKSAVAALSCLIPLPTGVKSPTCISTQHSSWQGTPCEIIVFFLTILEQQPRDVSRCANIGSRAGPLGKQLSAVANNVRIMVSVQPKCQAAREPLIYLSLRRMSITVSHRDPSEKTSVIASQWPTGSHARCKFSALPIFPGSSMRALMERCTVV